MNSKSQNKKVAFYAGSFDPLTRGHWNIICEALTLFSKVYVGIGVNANKKSLLTPDERKKCIEQTISDFMTDYRMQGAQMPKSWQIAAEKLSHSPQAIEPIVYNGLTIDAAIKVGADTLVRGVRNAEDTAYEEGLSRINSELLKVRGRELEQVILMPKNQKDFIHISSSMTKSLCAMQEYITAEKMVFPNTYQNLLKQYITPCVAENMKHVFTELFMCSDRRAKIPNWGDRSAEECIPNWINHMISEISNWKDIGAGLNYLNIYEVSHPFKNSHDKKEVQNALFFRQGKISNMIYAQQPYVSSDLFNLISTDFSKKNTDYLTSKERALLFIEHKISQLRNKESACVVLKNNRNLLTHVQSLQRS